MRITHLLCALLVILGSANSGWGQLVRPPIFTPPGLRPTVIPIGLHGPGQAGGRTGGWLVDADDEPTFAGRVVGALVTLSIFFGAVAGTVAFARKYVFVSSEKVKSMSGFIGTANPLVGRIVCVFFLGVLICLSGGSGGLAFFATASAPVEVWFWVVGLIGVVGLGVIGVNAWRDKSTVRLCITGVPPGSAPEEIRRAWIGIELPLRPGQSEPSMHLMIGEVFGLATVIPLVGGPAASHETVLGYAVDGSTALQCLAEKSPEAAEWWRQNAPHAYAPGYDLVFPCEVCSRLK